MSATSPMDAAQGTGGAGVTTAAYAAYAANGAPVSAERFYALACDPRRSVAVEACAGAGKTWMLVSRMLRALLDGAAPHEILAITFTKKAAGEMRARLHEWLDAFAQADDATLTKELRMRGLAQPTAAQVQGLRGLRHQCLAQGRGVQVRTFHSWFSALLRHAPWSVLERLGLPQRYTLLEDASPAERLLWRRFWASLAQDADLHADYRATVAVHGRFNTLKALQAALDKRVEFALADAHGVVEASVRPVGEVFPAYAALGDPAQRLRGEGAQKCLWDAARTLGAATLPSLQKLGAALEAALTDHDGEGIEQALLTKTGEPRKLSDKLAQVERVQTAQALLLEHRQALLQHQAWLHQQRMARLARRVLSDFALVKAENGWLDMGDLERAAHMLLCDPVLGAWVQERLDAQVRQLLIDEFQDTNPLQWQALQAWLSAYAGAGQGLGVFIVGDPKQSIYRFRRAEPQVFLAAQAFVREALGGDLLSCDHTRRNAPGVIEVVNATFLAAQARGAVQGFRSHTTASGASAQLWALPPIARPSDADEGAEQALGVWRDSLSTPRHTPEEGRRVREARQLALWLAQEIGAGRLAPQEVMVLSRKREPLGLVQSQLWALGIASVQPEKLDLSEQPEVQDIVALLDALLNPGHDLALARALKSPVFGWDDDALMALVQRARLMDAAQEWMPLTAVASDAGAGTALDVGTGAGVGQAGAYAPRQGAQRTSEPALRAPLMAALMSCLTDATCSPGERQAAQCLQRWGRWLALQAPFDALSRIYADADVLARFAASTPATARESVLAHLQAVLGVALALDGGRFASAYALVRALRQSGQSAPQRAQEHAVQLLTVHGAKGLEARCVVLLDTDAAPARAPSMGVLLEWPGEAAYPQRLTFLASESAPPPCTRWALEREQRERSREDANTLYVALTRAQSMLVLSSIAPHREQAYSWWQQLREQVQMLPEAQPAAPLQAAQTDDGVALDVVAPLNTEQNRPFPLACSGFVATNIIVNDGPEVASELAQQPLAARLGQALHRLLEWAPVRGGGYEHAPLPWSAAQLQSVRHAFALDAAQADTVRSQAAAVLQGQGAWAWDEALVDWHSNEVPLVAHGRALRLDRLVRLRDGGPWWVLDHKSHTHPLQQQELVEQLAQYRQALQPLVGPGAVVRAAFLSADGGFWEWSGNDGCGGD